MERNEEEGFEIGKVVVKVDSRVQRDIRKSSTRVEVPAVDDRG